jgi:hypothetical protein
MIWTATQEIATFPPAALAVRIVIGDVPRGSGCPLNKHKLRKQMT